jgi:serine/threonine protein kinase
VAPGLQTPARVGSPCPTIAPATADPLIGQLIGGRYLVRRRLASGGMCAIYELGHRVLNRRFALKILAPELAADPYALARFGREAEVVAGLCHPNVVSILDWDQLEDGSPFLVMELLDGEDLLARIAGRGGLPLDEIARIADELLAGLTVAHRAGIVHRDLKPSNIFLARDGAGGERAVLLDFGISKLRGVETLSGLQESVGTPLYMAPEQVRAQQDEVGPAADVWSMGAILHEMATGSPAFDADNLPAIVHRVLCGRPTPLRRRRPDLPDSFERLVARALDPDPARRPRDAEALRAELREVVEWSGEQSVTDVDLPPFSGLPTDRVVVLAAPPRRRRLRWPLALGLALGFLVAAASGVALAAALTGS